MVKEDAMSTVPESSPASGGIHEQARQAVEQPPLLSPVTESLEHTDLRADGQTTAPMAPGRMLGKCLLIEPLGRGGACTVFRAWHQTLRLAVAVKVLHLEPDDPRRPPCVS